MITIKQGLKISAIIDKMGLKITNPNASQEEVGADLIMQFISKAYKAEPEIYDLIMSIKHCSQEEAENTDLIEFIKELANTAGMSDFFKSAVMSK